MQFELQITPKNQRIAAVVLALLPAAAVVITLVSFISEQIDHHRRVALLTRELSRERAVVAQSAGWETGLTRIKASSLWRNLFVSGASQNQQGALAHLVTNVGGTVEQSSTERIKKNGAIELNERVAFRADIGQLVELLSELRKSQPLFVVRQISVQDLEPAGSTLRAVPNALKVDLTVVEFVKPS